MTNQSSTNAPVDCSNASSFCKVSFSYSMGMWTFSYDLYFMILIHFFKGLIIQKTWIKFFKFLRDIFWHSRYTNINYSSNVRFKCFSIGNLIMNTSLRDQLPTGCPSHAANFQPCCVLISRPISPLLFTTISSVYLPNPPTTRTASAPHGSGSTKFVRIVLPPFCTNLNTGIHLF